jgi:hypothetical protein
MEPYVGDDIEINLYENELEIQDANTWFPVYIETKADAEALLEALREFLEQRKF